MISKSHYISDGETEERQLYNIKSALDIGIKCIQFRFKNAENQQRLHTAEKVKFLCDEYHCDLIINDHIDIALDLDANGVHLGLSDTSIAIARKLMPNKIIGGTANTLQHLIQRNREGCDYIGLGPYRFTVTKRKLHPILGIENYKILLSDCVRMQLSTPIIAIGGIQLDDIEELLRFGVYGIAYSSLINNSNDKKLTALTINNLLYGHI
ncbi:thiamine phosphate synthase [Flavobacterium sp. NKUCC04_CG]|uniref:thiamine phosphate synthase n=1 Tax=Flavobacterium sp. NKUCC04_CG TaxID=2842121 RepID=UPI001C5AC2C0|nr:thiamine phosphate synthase [Flavobacterium sp. NKUCC04_CG]MBW3518592.1 thiamine phosphate synthase [Flavobacterium sp. NKUCC04_CG]